MNASSKHGDGFTLRGFSSLAKFGIGALTREACAYSQRMLCDVNAQGLALLSDYLGVPELTLAPPMNSQVDGQPSVGSLMLSLNSRSSLARFIAFREGALAYAEEPDGTLHALFNPEHVDRYNEIGLGVVRNYSLSTSVPHVGSRNVHQMTGRVI